MAELKEIKLSQLDPNPFRDGSGGTPPATWESVSDVYGFDEQKLEELAKSYEINGVWTSVTVRPVGNKYQLAFGHHRVEAARRANISHIPVIVEPLGDDQMLQRMASENSEEYGHDFALGIMNAVEAVVKAYGAGLIKLEAPKQQRSELRSAPSFVRILSTGGETKPYHATTVGVYLGWTKTTAKGVEADKRVVAALDALELIEKGALKRNQLKGLGSSQARELITVTRRKMETEAAKVEQQRENLEREKQKALKEDDKRKVALLDKKREELDSAAERLVKVAGQQAAGTVVEFFKESKSMVQAAAKAAETLELPPAPKKKVARPVVADVDYLTEKINNFLRVDNPEWVQALTVVEDQGYGKTTRLLYEALEALSVRLEERRKELKKLF